MNIQVPATRYGIDIQVLPHRVAVYQGDTLLAASTRAKVMYETRLPAAIYIPLEDVVVPVSEQTRLKTFCPFKGTARYRNIELDGETLENALWSYDVALPESRDIEGYVAFMAGSYTDIDLGENTLEIAPDSSVSGPLIDWLVQEAPRLQTPAEFTGALAQKLVETGLPLLRFSVMIWSLDPLIVGKNYIWDRGLDTVTTYAPPYEIHSSPAFRNSPLRHVSNGFGGVRQQINADQSEGAFPIVADLRKKGATDYVAMPLRFSDGRPHVMTLTSDRDGGFSTADLGMVFECASLIARFYEVFVQKENAQSLLETYLGKRTGARVLGGEIRRGDGDEIDAAIMFCDLRHSTRLEETLGRKDYIALLNQFFETVSDIIQDHGGEVLKFIGDAVLAVFPAGDDATDARARALHSATQIVTQLKEQGGENQEHGAECAIGIASGPVTYGNVGSRERLDFTVIGRAANIAARLGDFGKTRDHSIVVTQDIASTSDNATEIGEISLRNVSQPVLCYAVGSGASES
ncbi:MAG: DUF427 domain-containing protein [Sedimentitalea sp.]